MTNKEKIEVIIKWYSHNGDSVWGEVKPDRARLRISHYYQLMNNDHRGILKKHHQQKIDKCYEYYSVISPQVMERKQKSKEVVE